jgi:hypothetical protein
VAWPSGHNTDIGPVPHPDFGPRWLPTGVPPSRAIDQALPATGPAGSAATALGNPGAGGEPDGRTRRRNRPASSGRGARQPRQAAPPPGQWPARATPTRLGRAPWARHGGAVACSAL